jgi:hypothetical protein
MKVHKEILLQAASQLCSDKPSAEEKRMESISFRLDGILDGVYLTILPPMKMFARLH